MTIFMQSTFPTVCGSFPVGSVHSNIGTCPLFLGLVVYLMSDLLIIKKKSFFPFLSFLFYLFFRPVGHPADAAFLHKIESAVCPVV